MRSFKSGFRLLWIRVCPIEKLHQRTLQKLFRLQYIKFDCRFYAHLDIIIKVILSAISTASFFLIGYGLAFGGESNGFCGTKYFALVGLPDEKLADAFFQFSFAAAAGTIVSGVVHERCTMTAYFCYTALISGTTKYILLSNFYTLMWIINNLQESSTPLPYTGSPRRTDGWKCWALRILPLALLSTLSAEQQA